MSTIVDKGVTFRLFAGCRLTSEIKMHLSQSKTWKQAAILPANKEVAFLEVHHLAKDYFGCYLPEEKIDLVSLKELILTIRKRLSFYCPECDTEAIKICIFPQVFVA